MDQVWIDMYNAAKAVLGGVTVSEYVTAGEVSAAVRSKSGKIYVGVCIDTCSTLLSISRFFVSMDDYFSVTVIYTDLISDREAYRFEPLSTLRSGRRKADVHLDLFQGLFVMIHAVIKSEQIMVKKPIEKDENFCYNMSYFSHNF